MSARASHVAILAAGLLALALAGAGLARPGLADELAFHRLLRQKPRATLGDAAQVFYAFRSKRTEEVAARRAAEELVEADLMPEDWLDELDDPVSLGQVSYLVCTTVEIDGGLIMRIFGPNRRSAYKECVHLKIVSAAGPHHHLSGSDLLNIVRRAERYRRNREGEGDPELVEGADPGDAYSGTDAAARRGYDD